MRKKSSVIHFPPNAPLEVVKYYRNAKTCNTQSVMIQILRNKASHVSYSTSDAAQGGGADSTPVTTGAARHYSQIFIGYVQTSVDELIGSLDTVVEKSFEARVLDHECEGVITFIPSLSAVIVNEESTSVTEE